jgi:hypothetical protein
MVQPMADKFSQATCDPYLGLSFLPLAADEEKWDVSNDAFHSALVSAPSFVCPDAVDPHVPLQAIFCGWHVVDSRERENPIWKMLRLIDERVFGLWTSKAQKAALMFVTHTLIKVPIHSCLCSAIANIFIPVSHEPNPGKSESITYLAAPKALPGQCDSSISD